MVQRAIVWKEMILDPVVEAHVGSSLKNATGVRTRMALSAQTSVAYWSTFLAALTAFVASIDVTTAKLNCSCLHLLQLELS